MPPLAVIPVVPRPSHPPTRAPLPEPREPRDERGRTASHRRHLHGRRRCRDRHRRAHRRLGLPRPLMFRLPEVPRAGASPSIVSVLSLVAGMSGCSCASASWAGPARAAAPSRRPCAASSAAASGAGCSSQRLNEVANADRPVRLGARYSIVVDELGVAFWNGGRRPRRAAQFPWREVRNIRADSIVVGGAVVPVLVLRVRRAGSSVELPIILVVGTPAALRAWPMRRSSPSCAAGRRSTATRSRPRASNCRRSPPRSPSSRRGWRPPPAADTAGRHPVAPRRCLDCETSGVGPDRAPIRRRVESLCAHLPHRESQERRVRHARASFGERGTRRPRASSTAMTPLQGAVVVATCNRFEAYLDLDAPEGTRP